MRKNRLKLIGSKYGRLTIIEECNPNCRVLCDCGKIVLKKRRYILSGKTRSCGCLQLENMQKAGSYRKLPIKELACRGLLYKYKKRAEQELKLPWNLTKTQFNTFLEGNCYYCGQSPSNVFEDKRYHAGESYIYNGLDRKDNTQGYTLINVVSCCFQCNLSKHTLSESQFYKWIDSVYERGFQWRRFA